MIGSPISALIGFSILCACVLTALSFILRRRYPKQVGWREWFWGAGLLSLGSLLVYLRGVIPDFYTTAIANPLQILGIGYFYEASRRSFGFARDLPWHLIAAGLQLTASLFLYFTEAEIEDRLLVISTLQVPLLLGCAFIFARPSRYPKNWQDYGCAAMFLLGGLLYWIRILLANTSFMIGDGVMATKLMLMLPSGFRVLMCVTLIPTLVRLARERSTITEE